LSERTAGTADPSTKLALMLRRVALVLLLALVAATPAAPVTVLGKKERIDNQIETLNERIAAARARERALAADIESVTTKIVALEREVGDVSRNLATLEQDLALQREKLAKITQLWRLQSQKLKFLRRQHAVAVERLNDRIVAVYESGNISSIEVLLSAASFSELVSRLDYVKQITDQDRRIADSVGRAKDRMRIAQARTTVTKRKAAAVTRAVAIRAEQTRAIRGELVAQETALSATKGEKQRTLVTVEQQRREYLHEVEALAQASAALTSRIQASQQSAASASPVVPSGGGLMWPVAGPVTSPFGWRWGRMHEGIDIAAPTGTAVHAAASGRVIIAGWMGGYGNLVVIDHGGGLSTAYGHNSSFAASSGASVSQGQVIAYAGSTGNSTGPHVHFEVRVNGAPVDPLGYLG
jgi:murein DD-endopeptidase MepM/ murein hydrolase activator NlpD